MFSTFNSIAIIGYGNWGKALAKIIVENPNNTDKKITICSKQNPVLVRSSLPSKKRENNLLITSDVKNAIQNSEIVIIATQAKDVQYIAQQIENNQCKFVLTSKGLDHENGQLLSDTLLDYNSQLSSDDVAVLSGPNFASEIMLEKPTLTTVASANKALLTSISNIFNNDFFRVELSDDIIGIQVCGMIKNIFAIGYGMLVGNECGENTKAAFITATIREVIVAIEAFGGDRETINTAAGIGDLIMTSHSITSRNHTFGKTFIQDRVKAQDILSDSTVEGYYTLMTLHRVKHDLMTQKMQICNAIYKIVFEGESIDMLIEATLKN